MGSCLRSGKCCTSFGVCITSFDLIRVSKAVGINSTQLVQFIPEPPNRERTEPAVIIDHEPYLMVLRWKKDLVCMFYSNAGCEIYKNRPILCRTYPFCFKDGKFAEMKSRACPTCWISGSDKKKQYLTDLKQYKREVAAYRKIVENWNATGGGSIPNFLKYILSETKNY